MLLASSIVPTIFFSRCRLTALLVDVPCDWGCPSKVTSVRVHLSEKMSDSLSCYYIRNLQYLLLLIFFFFEKEKEKKYKSASLTQEYTWRQNWRYSGLCTPILLIGAPTY